MVPREVKFPDNAVDPVVLARNRENPITPVLVTPLSVIRSMNPVSAEVVELWLKDVVSMRTRFLLLWDNPAAEKRPPNDPVDALRLTVSIVPLVSVRLKLVWVVDVACESTVAALVDVRDAIVPTARLE